MKAFADLRRRRAGRSGVGPCRSRTRPGVAGEPAARASPTRPPAGAQRKFCTSVEGDDATTRAFIESSLAPRFRDAFPIEDHVRINAQMREESGGFDAVDVRVSEPTSIEVVVRARKTGEPAC